eukprot:gene11872-biopygen5603
MVQACAEGARKHALRKGGVREVVPSRQRHERSDDHILDLLHPQGRPCDGAAVDDGEGGLLHLRQAEHSAVEFRAPEARPSGAKA